MRDAMMLAIGLVVGLLIGWCCWLDQVLQRQAAERRAKAAEDLAASRAPCRRAREMPPLIVAYDAACSPHPWPSERVVWVSTDNAADAWAAIGGSAA
jgi:hypothetical protein